MSNQNTQASQTNQEATNGYIASAEMKEVQAIELDLLRRFLEYCQANNLRCWAEGGTLLGAVRHKGFIPWDDDVDLMMPREDYDRMCQTIGNKGIEAPYFLQTAYSDVDYHRGHAQFRRSDTTAIRPSDCFQPFNQGIFIDIFPLEAVPDDQEALHRAYRSALKTLKFLKAKNTHCISSGRLGLIFRKLKARHCVRRNGWLHYYEKADDEMRRLADLPGTRVGEVVNMGPKLQWDRSLFDETVWLPFENIKVPAPKDTDTVLRAVFGDNYMTPIQAPSMHGQVVFDTHRSYKEVLPEVRRQYRMSALTRLVSKLTGKKK